MTTVQPYLTDAFAGLNVLVIGEAMLDGYLKGYCDRLCREAPVPIITLDDCEYVPGGAANAAVNIRSLGADINFLSVIGEDREGDLLRQALSDCHVSHENVLSRADRRTLAKQRVVSAGQVLLRFDQGSTASLDEVTEEALVNRLEQLYPDCDAVLISNYAYGILSSRVLDAIARLQRRHHRLLAVDSKQLMDYRRLDVTVIKPNYQEIIALLDITAVTDPSQRADQLLPYEERIMELTEARIVAVTLDQDGALIFERGCEPYRTYARPSPHSRAAGAGDTFISALTLALAAGAETHTAAELAAAASAVVVSKEGTCSCTSAELRDYMSSTGSCVQDADQLAEHIEIYRRQGKRIVFTNGCFDILHRGHITYLNRAKSLGDILVLGLNSDDSIRRLKGSSRPINTLEDRAQVMAALSCIDYIVPFSEDTPVRLIRKIRPDIFVKGGDYTRETLPEAEVVESYGGSVRILSYLDNFSTTSMIERIREVYAGSVQATGTVRLMEGGA